MFFRCVFLALLISGTMSRARSDEKYFRPIAPSFNQQVSAGTSSVPSRSGFAAKAAQDANALQYKLQAEEKSAQDIILPHIAKYNISLDKRQDNGDVDDVNGYMTIKIWDTGDGWVYEQNSSLVIYSASGEGEQINTNVATWQDYAGKHYRFNSRTLRNGQEENIIRGEASSGKENRPGKVTYHLPNYMEIEIPEETIFPLHHLIHTVKNAMQGNYVVSNIVFDGSAETQEAVTVNTAISPAKNSKINFISEKPLPVDLAKVWSMKLGVYSLNSKSIDPEPEYEIKQDVLGHCIVKKMTLDYGTFQVLATLDRIEFFTET